MTYKTMSYIFKTQSMFNIIIYNNKFTKLTNVFATKVTHFN